MILAIILGLAVVGITGLLFGNIWGSIPLGLAIIGLGLGLKQIPAKPPHMGLVTIWGERKDKIKKEGWRLLAPYFPFLYDIILINLEKKNEDWDFVHIRCKSSEGEGEPKSGGEVSLKVLVTWKPDKNRLMQYIDSGGENGIRDIMRDMLEEDVRQMGRHRSWEEMTFSGDELMKSLVKKLTGEEPKPDQTPNEFQRELQTNGFPDIADIGIVITRLNVGRIKEEGELAKVAENQAKEVQERRAEVYEVDTEIRQAQQLFEAYKKAETPIPLKDCLMEIRRRKSIREGRGAVYDIPGLGEGLEEIGKAISKIFGGER